MSSSGIAARVTFLVVVIGLIAAGAGFGQPGREAGNRGSAADDKGFVITAVDPGSPADKAGVKRGDILIKIDKIEPQAAADLGYYVSRLKAGDSLDLELLRGGASTKVAAKIAERNGSPYLGVTLEGELLGGMGFRQDRTTPRGMQMPRGWTTVEAYVEEVLDGSPAAAAGIKAGDRIVGLAGEDLRGGGSLATEIAKHKPGDKVTLEIQRQGGAVEKLEVALAASTDDASKPYLGVRYREVPVISYDLPEGMGRAFGLRGASVVHQVASGSPAEQAGIKVGDLITRVGEDEVTAATPLADLVAKHKPGEKVDLTLYDLTGGAERTVTVTLGARSGEPEKAYLGVVTGGRMFFSTPEVTPEWSTPRRQSPRLELRDSMKTPAPAGI